MVRNKHLARESEEEPLLQARRVELRQQEGKALSFRKQFDFVSPYIIPQTPRAKRLTVASTLSTIIYKASLFLPGISSKVVIDAVSSSTLSRDEKAIKAAFGVSLYFIGRLGAAVFSSFQNITYEKLSQDISRRFGARTYEHLLLLDVNYHTRVSAGKSFEILNRGITSIALLLRVFVLQLGPTLLEAVVIGIIFVKLGTTVRIAGCAEFSRVDRRWRHLYSLKMRIDVLTARILFPSLADCGMHYAFNMHSLRVVDAAYYEVASRVSKGGC